MPIEKGLDIVTIKINGLELPICSDFSGSLSDLDLESGRNVTDGVMVRNVLRRNIYKLEFSYDLMEKQIASSIINILKKDEFQVEFFSIEENQRITRTMYCGDKTYNFIMADFQEGKGYDIQVQNFKFNLIEM